MSNSTCNPTGLQAVLEDRKNDPRFDSTVEHLSYCQGCQSQLDELAAGPWWWTSGRDLVQSSVGIEPQESTSRIVAIGNDEPLPKWPPAAAVDSPDHFDVDRWSTDFLQPPSHSEFLGRLGKYEIERVVGRGGMGIVFKAFDTELNRAVAIKVLAPHLASNGVARQRFAREAQAAAAVVHDHVVAIHGIESSGELPYLVMPFIGGDSLQNYVRKQGPLKTKDVVRIAMQVAAGLAAAHEQGLVHRDVKPANVMLENGFGRVLITDFGLARAADDASITRTGLVAGTPHYMSPEQADGESVDHRSDLFSLGSVMYFMASGQAPFHAEGAMAVLRAICHRQPIDIRELNDEVPDPLALIITRLHRKKPSERFDSATQLRNLLADYLAHLQNPIRNALPASLRKKKSSSLFIALGAVVCLAYVAVVCWPSGVLQHDPASDSASNSTRPRGESLERSAIVGETTENEASQGRRALSSGFHPSATVAASRDHMDDAIEQLASQVANLESEFRHLDPTRSNNQSDERVLELESATQILEQIIRADLSTEY